jgi:hypothetical protein
VCLSQSEQILYCFDLAPLERGRTDPEAPLQLRHQAKTVGLTMYLQISAETNRTAEVAAGAERDFFQESVNGGGGIGCCHTASAK